MGDTSSPYVADALGNLIPIAPDAPYVDSSGAVWNPDGTLSSSPVGQALSALSPPWWVYAGLAIVALIVLKDLTR